MPNKLTKPSLLAFFWPVVTGLLLAIVYLQYQRLQGIVAANDTAAPLRNKPSEASYADAVARVIPSVVNISTTNVVRAQQHPLFNDPVFRRFFGNRVTPPGSRTTYGLGSGVIVSQNGHIVTNDHVISNAKRVRVMLNDGRERDAHLIGTDVETDIAVLKIDLDNLPAVEFAAEGSVRIGDVVLAIGNPYGFEQTVTQGIVSALGRHGLNLNTYESYIQTDAAINQGNSGGALVNTSGQLVGINSGLFSKTGGFNGIGFAIPNAITRHVLEQIINHGEVVRGWLGISGFGISPAAAERAGIDFQAGLIINQLVKGGPADLAGLQSGDIITHINGEKIDNANTSINEIAHSTPGETINLGILRSGAAQSVLVKVGKKPEGRSN
ncbi:MAG: PDZ domain-containing protein [Pseudomonadales bacterium]|nr:PDZ domain-containing protein [Pseudomonadales bacterium]